MIKTFTRTLSIILAAILVTLSLCAFSNGGKNDSRNIGGSKKGGSGKRTATAGMSMQVDEGTGAIRIERPKIKKPSPMGEKDTWTVFVYLCGSDLESKRFTGGMGTADIEEMCKATASDRVRFVIETGGCKYWHNKSVDKNSLGRFIIEGGKLRPVGKVSQASMGKASTLTDFLSWGLQTYPAEKMGVVFWDHGGGSITGVCFDELEKDDSLSLREIDAAMLSVLESGILTDTFEFIGFDACLMGTVEAANIAANYARYMIGSEESEPGSGWDYTAIGSYLAKNPGASGADLGKVICDSFKKQCEASGDGQIATMSVIDLSGLDSFLKAFNSFARDMYTKSEKKDTLNSMVRGIRNADNFGGNNKAEGYTNMVDLGGLIKACGNFTSTSDAAVSALDKAVVYKTAGSDHTGASGLSVYYPLSIQGSKEIKTFESVCVSPYYLSFVGRQGYGSVNSGDTEDYDDESLFPDGIWSWLNSFLFDDETGDYDYEVDEESDDWSFFDDHEDGAQSGLITFEEEPGIDEDGTFSFTLDDNGFENTSDVCALAYQEMKDGSFIELGEIWDVNLDPDSGYVSDNFDGRWLSLPDGQNLATYIVEVTDDYVVYTSPILLGEEETCLRMRQYFDDSSVEVEGAWDGIDETGASSKNVIKLQKGDVITPTWYSISEEGEDLDEYVGEPFTLTGKKLDVDYDLLYEGDYTYAFCITDIYGDDFITDMASFSVDEAGEVTVSEYTAGTQ